MEDKKAGVLGWKLMLARKQRRRTQEDVSMACGVHKQTVSNWERGTVVPSFLNVVRAVQYLGASLEWVADPRESMPEGAMQ